MVSSVEKRGDAEEHGLAHRKKRDYDLADQPGITVSRLLQDDQVAGDTFERLYAEGGARGGGERYMERAWACVRV